MVRFLTRPTARPVARLSAKAAKKKTTPDIFAALHEMSFAPTLPAITDLMEWSERRGVRMQIRMENPKHARH